MPDDYQQRKCHEFLVAQAKSGSDFTADDLGLATGWQGDTPRTYLGKQLKTLVTRKNNRYHVHRHFLYWSVEQFLQLVSQTERGLPSYRRETLREIVTYDFLLPLANERTLREILDSLFYKETLVRILQTIDPATLQQYFPKSPTQNEDDYFDALAISVAKQFGGYSIMHAAGRFRAEDLMTKPDAAKSNYIIDETTAFVRFIIPCTTSRRSGHNITTGETIPPTPDTLKEIQKIRFLFLNVFAETLVLNILNEQEIWLIENTTGHQQLYRWISKD